MSSRCEHVCPIVQLAAFERLVSGLWGVFIVSMLSVVFLAGFAFLQGR